MSINLTYGWISPDGEFYHCYMTLHLKLAEKILYKLNMPTSSIPGDKLISLGWCKIIYMYNMNMIISRSKNRPNYFQTKRLYKLSKGNPFRISGDFLLNEYATLLVESKLFKKINKYIKLLG